MINYERICIYMEEQNDAESNVWSGNKRYLSRKRESTDRSFDVDLSGI